MLAIVKVPLVLTAFAFAVGLVGTAAQSGAAVSTIAVGIATPMNGQSVGGKVTWKAKVPTGTATSVSFSIDGASRWTEYAAPFIFNGDGNVLDTKTLTSGTHTLSVTAKDAQGGAATNSIQVTVSNGTTKTARVTPRRPPGTGLYSASSPFNTPIASGAAIDPNSNAMVQSAVSAAAAQGFVIASKHWSVPVYYANSTTPKTTVRLTASWAPYKKLASVPMPSGAAPDPEGDGHMAIIDTSTNCEYDFYGAVRRFDGTWAAAWANSLLTTGTGIFPFGLSAREAGFGLGAGLILPGELAAGRINHALNFAYPYTKAGGAVLPATEAAGKRTAAGAIPEGARLQLDPSLNLDSLGLSAWQKTVARALQRYGMFLSDTGGGVSLFAQNPQSTSVAYPWGDVTYPALPTSLISRLRVLKLTRNTLRRPSRSCRPAAAPSAEPRQALRAPSQVPLRRPTSRPQGSRFAR